MRKFAAHYLLNDTGLLLKNGIAQVEDNGTIQFVDTKGELQEMERLVFHSGLLFRAFEFRKVSNSITRLPPFETTYPLLRQVTDKDLLTPNEVIDLARQLQVQCPQMNIPQIIRHIEQVLQAASFEKKTIPGLYLLSALDLGSLRFTEKTRLKKIV